MAKYNVEITECQRGKVIFSGCFEADSYNEAISKAGKKHYGTGAFVVNRGLTQGSPEKYAQYGQYAVGGSTRESVCVVVNEA